MPKRSDTFSGLGKVRFRAVIVLAALLFSSCKVHTITAPTEIKTPVELKKTRVADKHTARIMLITFIVGFALGVHYDVQDLFNH